MARNYRKEYDNYQGRPEQVKRRTARNAARRKAMKKKMVRKGDGKDINHRSGNPMDNRMFNLEPLAAPLNRSFPRTRRARKRNPKD